MEKIRYVVFWSIFITCIPFVCLAHSTGHHIDSLEQELEEGNADSVRISLLVALANRLPDSTQAVSHFMEALKVAENSTYELALAKTYLNLGSWYYDRYHTDEAEHYMLKVKSLISGKTSAADRALLAKVRINMANIAWQRNDFEQAIEGYFDVIPLLNDLEDNESLALVNGNIGILFNNQKQRDKSTHYLLKSIAHYQLANTVKHENIADSYIIIAMGMFEMDSLDQVAEYLAKAKHELQQHKDSSKYWASYYYNQGRYEYATDQSANAEESFNKAISISRHYNDAFTTCSILLALSELYEANGQYGKSKPLLDELLEVSRSINVGAYQLKALRAKSRMEYLLRRPEQAYRNLNEYVDLQDSLQVNEVTNQLHLVEEKYKLAEAENKLLILQNENEKKDFALQRNKLLIGLLIAITIPLLVVCILVYRFYQNKKRLLNQQHQLHQLEMDRIKQAHRISLLSAILEGQEGERTRLARDLHDGLGGMLSAVKIELSGIVTQLVDNDAQQTALTKTVGRLDDAVDELRYIAHSMMPGILMKYGLDEAMRAYCHKLKKAGINILFQAFNYDNEMDQSRQVLLYRIMQELVNNAIKHAEAHRIFVQLQQVDDTVSLLVEDNGKGFDLGLSDKTGAGLANIKTRVELLEGSLDIHSEKDIGTSAMVECSLRQQHALMYSG